MWTWDGTSWTQEAPALFPPARVGHAFAAAHPFGEAYEVAWTVHRALAGRSGAVVECPWKLAVDEIGLVGARSARARLFFRAVAVTGARVAALAVDAAELGPRTLAVTRARRVCGVLANEKRFVTLHASAAVRTVA